MMKACKVKFVLIRLINGKFIQQQECYDFVQTLWNGGKLIPRLFALMALIVLMCWLSQTNSCLSRSSYTPTGIFRFDLKISRWKILCCRTVALLKQLPSKQDILIIAVACLQKDDTNKLLTWQNVMIQESQNVKRSVHVHNNCNTSVSVQLEPCSLYWLPSCLYNCMYLGACNIQSYNYNHVHQHTQLCTQTQLQHRQI